jgi:hypothetical protein
MIRLCLCGLLGVFGLVGLCAATPKRPSHGLWVWQGPRIIASAAGSERLLEFCRTEGIDEVYLSVADHGDLAGLARFGPVIEDLHRAQVRVEALLSSETADEPGRHRDKLLRQVREVLGFNASHPGQRFDGVHLDIEPQQRPENKGSGNLQFVPGLTAAYRAVWALAEPAGLTVDADIPKKLLEGDVAERRMLLTALPRLTLMLYEVNRPGDGASFDEQSAHLQAVSRQLLVQAYADLNGTPVAMLAIGLRTPDYGEDLGRMLRTLESGLFAQPGFRGWARHSYNDTLPPEP